MYFVYFNIVFCKNYVGLSSTFSHYTCTKYVTCTFDLLFYRYGKSYMLNILSLQDLLSLKFCFLYVHEWYTPMVSVTISRSRFFLILQLIYARKYAQAMLFSLTP